MRPSDCAKGARIITELNLNNFSRTTSRVWFEYNGINCPTLPDKFLIKGKIMRDKQLKELNFKKLISYKEAPHAKRQYDPPLECSGFCVSCEENGVSGNSEQGLWRMSHGCDSEDYFNLFGRLPATRSFVQEPIMFLFEAPSWDEDLSIYNLEKIRNGQTKEIPNYYYWASDALNWPRFPSDLEKAYNPIIKKTAEDYYGLLVAYLANLFSLSNIYITNLVKCVTKGNKWDKPGSPKWKAVRENCAEEFLKREIEIFKPKLVVCFGDAVYDVLDMEAEKKIKVYHPGSTRWMSGTKEEKAKTFIAGALESDRAGVVNKLGKRLCDEELLPNETLDFLGWSSGFSDITYEKLCNLDATHRVIPFEVGDQVTHNLRTGLGIGEIVEILPDGRIAAKFRSAPQKPVHTDKPYMTFRGISPLSVTKI